MLMGDCLVADDDSKDVSVPHPPNSVRDRTIALAGSIYPLAALFEGCWKTLFSAGECTKYKKFSRFSRVAQFGKLQQKLRGDRVAS